MSSKRRKTKLAEVDDEREHRIRVIAYCLRAGRKPPTGMTLQEKEAALKLLEGKADG